MIVRTPQPSPRTGRAGSHGAEKLVLAAEGAEGPAVRHGGPVLPAVAADLVATAQRLRAVLAPLREGLETDGALGLAVRGQELKTLLEAFEDRRHLEVVPLRLAHHVKDEPLPCAVRDAHGLRRVDAPDLLVHVRGHCCWHGRPALRVELQQAAAHLLDLGGVALVQQELRRALGLVGRLLPQLRKQGVHRAAAAGQRSHGRAATASCGCESLRANSRHGPRVGSAHKLRGLLHGLLLIIGGVGHHRGRRRRAHQGTPSRLVGLPPGLVLPGTRGKLRGLPAPLHGHVLLGAGGGGHLSEALRGERAAADCMALHGPALAHGDLCLPRALDALAGSLKRLRSAPALRLVNTLHPTILIGRGLGGRRPRKPGPHRV
mmetsp:Transcript_9228/g.25000  ORF Transcript_9228/g.25000 Transcript_9228/m.25000 type:complete len:375 (-) Transcript_9228:97-1221(-)